MRQDLPTPIRGDLDRQRLEFIRWIGTSYEELVSLHIDPTPWITTVIAALAEAKKADERPANRAA